MAKGRGARSNSRYVTPAYSMLPSAEYLASAEPHLISKAPGAIWAAGDVSLLHTGFRVAIVGARDATPEGARRSAKLARELARAGVTIVSGLARGIDLEAHAAALEAGGRTIAVIGTPIDKAYPAEHSELQMVIAKHHLVVSQFPIGQRVFPSNFINRNRLMALLVHASVIIEASDTSGSLSQASETQSFGRPVFFMRSVLENEKLAWPKRFMEARNPAIALDRPEQILEAIGARASAY